MKSTCNGLFVGGSTRYAFRSTTYGNDLNRSKGFYNFGLFLLLILLDLNVFVRLFIACYTYTGEMHIFGWICKEFCRYL